MVYRYSWIAGIAGIGLAYWELSSLLRPSTSGTSWQVAIIVAVLLSMGVTWTSLAYRANVWLAMIGNLIAYILVVGLLVAPDTLWGIFPTFDTLTAIQSEFARALEIIQHGVEPVRPVPGLIMLFAGLFWILGFLLVAGLLNSRPFVAVLTPIIIALQFVIIDRRPKGLVHIAMFVGIAAFALVAVRLDERDHGTGRLARTNAVTAPSKRPSLGVAMLLVLTIVASLVSVVLAGDRVPSDGVVSWRSAGGYSDSRYSGSGTYNPYTDIRANLISQSNNPLFTATIEGADPASVRFRMVTLDTFQNGRWQPNRFQAFPLDEEPWISEAQAYRGPTTSIAVSVTIQNLQMPWLPTPVTATAAVTDDRSDYAALRTRRLDGSLYLPGDFTREGMKYAVLAEIPEFTAAEFEALARDENGQLSPLFEAAEDDGRNLGLPTDLATFEELPDEEYWTEFPDDLGTRVEVLARGVTANMDTNFERALALEDYFRYSGGFTYNTSVPSEFTTDKVENWLFDDTNGFARNGYCEQFATTMALMARTLGMPSRVVLGFTPGRVLNDDTVLVMDRNAHSWVEIWIPSHGWMAFDPTPRGDYDLPTTNDAFREALGFSAADYADAIPLPTFFDTGGLDPLLEQLLNGPDDFERFRGTGGGGETETTGFTLPGWALPAGILVGLIALIVLAAPLAKWSRRRRRARRLANGDIAAAWDDITERLSDLGERVNAAATPLELADSIDNAFVPLATSYGDALYGEKESSTAVIDRATQAHSRAEQHLTTRYSKPQRLRAVYRPTRLRRRLRKLFSRSKT
jgi:transglutaminase-like putative cysteine protease